ncbi:hypothetical protein [Agrobacterium sp. NPDC090283]|uniref:hypothetical protein n=1 Tax=Agrobacterium sp. NPDC090283 TaxID=3363920 RepID=UPI00383AB450
MTSTEESSLKPASEFGLLSLYTHQHSMADANLAVERDITVKHYMAFGTVLLLQTGFFATKLQPHVIFIACGAVIICISLAARAMVIFYGKYSSRLFAIASVYRKAYLRGRDGNYVIRKANELQNCGHLPEANRLSFKEYLSYTGALATINTIPSVIGAILALIGLVISFGDLAPSIRLWLLVGNAPT